MLIYVLSAASILLIIDLLRRMGPFAAVTVSTTVFCGSLMYYGLTDAKYTGMIGTMSAEASRKSAQNETTVELVYALGAFLTWLSAYGMRREKSIADERALALRKITNKWLSESSLTVPALMLILACCLNAGFSLSSPLANAYTNFFAKVCGMFCVVGSAILVAAWFQRFWGVVVMVVPCIAYSVMFLFGSYSRFIAVSVAVGTMLAMELRARNNLPRISVFTLGGLALTVYFYFFALQGRVDRRMGLDWHVIGSHLRSVELDVDWLYRGLLNIFLGPSVLAGALNMKGVHYDSPYQILSLSPLPAALDGFKLEDQVRLGPFTPFSAICEAYYFEWPFSIACIGVYMFCIRQLTRLYCQYDEVAALAISAPGILASVMIQEYPIRTSLRFYLYGAIVAFLCAKFMDARATALSEASGPETA